MTPLFNLFSERDFFHAHCFLVNKHNVVNGHIGDFTYMTGTLNKEILVRVTA